MTATKTKYQAGAKPPPGAKPENHNGKPPPGAAAANPPGDDGPPPVWDDVVRQGTVLRLMEHLNVGVQLVTDLGKDPAFSADDRLQAVLVAARMITANAHLGKAIATLAQVEHRRRTVVQHLDPPASSKHSNSIPEVLLERDITRKLLRYMKVIADESLGPAIQAAAEAAQPGTANGDGKSA